MKEIVTLIYGHDDYAPVLVHSSTKGIVFSGDNIHDTGYKEFAEGYAKALGTSYQKVYIEDTEDLNKIKEFLSDIGEWERFLKYYDYEDPYGY